MKIAFPAKSVTVNLQKRWEFCLLQYKPRGMSTKFIFKCTDPPEWSFSKSEVKISQLKKHLTFGKLLFTYFIYFYFFISSFCILGYKKMKMDIQSNLYKSTTLGTTQKWLSWTGGCLIKHLYKMTSNKIWSFLAGF